MEPLSDPRKDRAIKSVKAPPHKPLSAELLWKDPDNPSNLISNAQLEESERSSEKRRKTIEKGCK